MFCFVLFFATQYLIVGRERTNPDYHFLFDINCPEHVYYKWKVRGLCTVPTNNRCLVDILERGRTQTYASLRVHSAREGILARMRRHAVPLADGALPDVCGRADMDPATPTPCPPRASPARGRE